MQKFKAGDRVRRTRAGLANMEVGMEFTVDGVSASGRYLNLEGRRGSYRTEAFELVADSRVLPLTEVLKMDRVIAQAGGSADILEEYLDKPLNEFIQKVMIPNGITLKHA